LITLGSLHIEFGTMLVQLIAFLILLFLVAKFALRPALKVLQDRQSYIEGQLNNAESARTEAQKLIEEQKKLLEDARKQAYELLETAKQQKDREADEILKAANDRAERMMQDATAEIQREKDKAVAELREQVGALSVLLASKIIEKQMDQKDQQALIDDVLKQVGGQ
jgi:F-type H+-transporting ATPase subunit b